MIRNDDVIPRRVIDRHWLLTKKPLPEDEERLNQVVYQVVIPRRQSVGRRHDSGRQRVASHDELIFGVTVTKSPADMYNMRAKRTHKDCGQAELVLQKNHWECVACVHTVGLTLMSNVLSLLSRVFP